MNSLDKFMESNESGYLHIGHASGLLRIKGKLILFDPCWNYRPFSEYWSLVPEQINCDHILDKIDMCIVSHIHDDHYTDKILNKLKCPVIVMIGRDDLTAKLRSFGADVIEVYPEVAFRTFLGIDLYFLKSSFNKVDSSVFVYTKNFGFYHGNDNFVSKEQIREARKYIPHVSLATIPYAYLNWYPENMLNLTREQKDAENDRLTMKLLDHAEMLIEEIDPHYVIPSAANLYYNDTYNSPFNEQGLTPWEFKKVTKYHDKVITFSPGDYVLGNEVYIGRTEQEYMEEISKNLEQNKPKQLYIDCYFKVEHLRRLQEKVDKATLSIPNHEIIFVINNLHNLVIDIEKKTVRSDFEKIFNKDYTMIFMEPYQLMKWLEGEMTYEQVVATRKFKMLRIPDIYNVDVFQYMLNFL